MKTVETRSAVHMSLDGGAFSLKRAVEYFLDGWIISDNQNPVREFGQLRLTRSMFIEQLGPGTHCGYLSRRPRNPDDRPSIDWIESPPRIPASLAGDPCITLWTAKSPDSGTSRNVTPLASKRNASLRRPFGSRIICVCAKSKMTVNLLRISPPTSATPPAPASTSSKETPPSFNRDTLPALNLNSFPSPTPPTISIFGPVDCATKLSSSASFDPGSISRCLFGGAAPCTVTSAVRNEILASCSTMIGMLSPTPE